MVKIALNMLWVKRKTSINLCLSITVSLCVSMIYLQFFSNPYLSKITLNDILDFSGNFIKSLLAFGVIIVCMCLVAYACNYNIRVHSKELGLVKLAGYNNIDILKYLFVQIIAIIICSCILSIVISIVIIPLVLYLIYEYLNISANPWYFNIDMFKQLVYLLLLILILIMFLEVRYCISKNITDLLKNDTTAGFQQIDHIINIPNSVYIMMYVVGIYSMFADKSFNIGFMIPSCIGAVGAYGMFYYFFPDIFKIALNKINISGLNSVILGDVTLFMKQIKMLIIFIMLSIIILPSTVLATLDIPIAHVSAHLASLLINILLSGSLINRFMIDDFEKKEHYSNLYKIGLTKREIKKISIQQTNYFYGTLLILVCIYLFNIFLTFMINMNISISVFLTILIECILPYVLSLIVIIIIKWRKNYEYY